MTTRKKQSTEVIVTDDIIADVVETTTPNGTSKRVAYKAPIKQNDDITEDNDETENNEPDFNNQNQNTSFSQSDFQEIPSDQIDVIFDDLSANRNPQDYFYAKLTRLPDAMQDRFFVPCNAEMPCGFFQFGLQDRLAFETAIQTRNGNSGGRFNIKILDSKQIPISVFVGYDNPYSARKEEIWKPVGAVNILIGNPLRDETPAANNGNSEVKMILEAMREQHNQFMIALQNNKPQQSQIEQLLLTKAVEMITNPPAPQQQNNAFETQMMTILAMPAMVERMSKKMFPEPPAPLTPSEPTTFDRILQLSQTPLAQNFLERVGDISEAIVMSKVAPSQMVNNPQENTQDAPEQIQAGEPINDEMKIILEELITELESESEINALNPTIVKLRNEHGEAFQTVEMLCQAASFDSVLQMLLTQANKIVPHPFAIFLNAEMTAFNERGTKAIERLRLVYEYLKAS